MSAFAQTIPASNRVEPGSVNIAAAEYPPSINTDGLSPETVAASVIDKFNAGVASKDAKAVAGLFTSHSDWRDHLCLTWDLRSFRGPEKIQQALQSSQFRLKSLAIDSSRPHRAPQVAPIDLDGKHLTVAFFVNVATELGAGRGYVRLTQDNGYWRILTLFTTLDELTGFEEPTGSRRPYGKPVSSSMEYKPWHERRESEKNFEDRDPSVLVIGGAQAGLSIAARLKMLNVPTLVIDKSARVGDSWRNRYKSLVLHDPVYTNHMSYAEFPPTWPLFTPSRKLANWFEQYVDNLELNVWTSTQLVSSSWDDKQKRWTVTVERQKGDEKETRTFSVNHVVQATGHSGKKNMPEFKGKDSFGGLLCHSSDYPGAVEGQAGRRAVVIGCCNSAHDIAQDMYKKGYDVTMVQRSSTCVVSTDSILKLLSANYSETSAPVDDADLMNFGSTSFYQKHQYQDGFGRMAENDRELLEGLQRAGFKLDLGPDRAGLQFKYHARGGGYYINVGASELIVAGKIKIKQGQEIDEILPDGVRFADGVVLPADEVVCATGYQNMRTEARGIFGDAVADRLHDVWGLDEEGEFRAVWRPSGHPGFWFMAGNLLSCRFFSRTLALQIKAHETGHNQY